MKNMAKIFLLGLIAIMFVTIGCASYTPVDTTTFLPEQLKEYQAGTTTLKRNNVLIGGDKFPYKFVQETFSAPSTKAYPAIIKALEDLDVKGGKPQIYRMKEAKVLGLPGITSTIVSGKGSQGLIKITKFDDTKFGVLASNYKTFSLVGQDISSRIYLMIEPKGDETQVGVFVDKGVEKKVTADDVFKAIEKAGLKKATAASKKTQ